MVNIIHDGVNVHSEQQLDRVSEKVIKDALNLMKAKKNDAILVIPSVSDRIF